MEKKQSVADASDLKMLLEKYRDVPDLTIDEINSLNARTRHDDQLIHIASVSGDADDVAKLIALGADVNSAGEDGYTALHYAAEQGHLSVLKVLLAHSADATLKDRSGESPLQIAKALGNDAVADFLERHAADSSASDA